MFTDVSDLGYGIVITQCQPGELDKPWAEQRHLILACHSQLFRNAQTRWSTSCKEGYALVQAVIRFRHLLEENVPFAFITDHAALMYVFGKSALTSSVGKASRDRLIPHRWSTFLRMMSIIYQGPKTTCVTCYHETDVTR